MAWWEIVAIVVGGALAVFGLSAVMAAVVGARLGQIAEAFEQWPGEPPPCEEHDGWLPEDDPLARAVDRVYNTGEPVVWRKGDPLPDPEGPQRKVPRDDDVV